MNCYGDSCFNAVEPGTTFCTECRVKNEERQRKARLERIATIEEMWNGGNAKWNSIRPPKKYHGAIWTTLSASMQKQIMPFVDGSADLLTFVGCPGAGKTWAAWAAASVFLVDHNKTYYHNHGYHGDHFFTNWYAINEAARDSRLFGDTGESNREWLNKLSVSELLVIDEFATARPYEAEFMSVMAVIHHRFDNSKSTVLITTKSEQELVESVGEAMLSRINSGIVIKMQGKDRRLRT